MPGRSTYIMARGGLFQRAVMTAETDEFRMARFCVLLHGFLAESNASFINVVTVSAPTDVTVIIKTFDNNRALH